MSARARIAWRLVSLALVVSVGSSWAAAADAGPAQNEDEGSTRIDADTPEEGGDCFVLTNVFVAFDPQSEPPNNIEPGTEEQVGTLVDWDDYTAEPDWTVDIPDTHYYYCLRNGAFRLLGSVKGTYEIGRPVDPGGLPTGHTCLMVTHTEATLGEIVPPKHPSDYYGPLQTQEEFVDAGDVDMEDVVEDQMYCPMGGIWVRGDLLSSGCGLRSWAGVPRGVTVTERCWGSFPTANYNITYASGAWNDFDSKIYGFGTRLLFDIGKTATALSLWAVGWAYEFDFDDFLGFVRVVGEDWQSKLIVPFGLEGIIFFVLVAWVAITILRGKAAQAVGEVVMSLLLMTLAAVLLANRVDYLESVGNVMDKASADLLVAGSGGDPAESSGDLRGAVHNMQASLHRSLVEQPYDYLQWGRSLDGTACEEGRNNVLGWSVSGAGVTENDDGDEVTLARHYMVSRTDGQCGAEAHFNDVPSGTRLVSSLLSLAVALVAAGLLGGSALTVVACKFGALLLFAVAPFAALVAGAPAGGRRLAWLWVAGVGQVTATVVVISFMLSLVGLSLEGMFSAMTDVGLEERFAIVLLLLLVLGAVRRVAVNSLASSSGRLADNLTNVRLGGGGAPWQGPSGSRGLALSGLEDVARAGVVRGTWAAGVGTALGTRMLYHGGVKQAGRLARAGGRVVAQRRREGRAWRNIVKARRTGDVMSRSQIKRTYPLGGGGHATSGPSSGPAPTHPGGTTRPEGQRPTAKARALDAEHAGKRHDAMFWQGVHNAETTYASRVNRTSPTHHEKLRTDYRNTVDKHRHAYQAGTGKPAPIPEAPWVTPAPVSGGGGAFPQPAASNGHGGRGSAVLEVTSYAGYGRSFRKDFKQAKRAAGVATGAAAKWQGWRRGTKPGRRGP